MNETTLLLLDCIGQSRNQKNKQDEPGPGTGPAYRRTATGRPVGDMKRELDLAK